jgi:DNA-binding NtrC family response regulator
MTQVADTTESIAEAQSSSRGPLPARARIVVVSGPDKDRVLEVGDGMYVVGKHEACDLPLTDGKVSRQHLELTRVPDGLRVRDIGSKNGSYYQGALFAAITIGIGASVKLGSTELLVIGPDEKLPLEVWEGEQFGNLMGASVAMRRVFSLLARYAQSDAPVLIRGESGTGKELLAAALHEQSKRASEPFVIGDLAAVTGTLIESELFGHVRGAFTGADHDRRGLFAEARGGTIFLDEIGELALEDQPRLLRALDQRQFRPVGASSYQPFQARVVAATNRSLDEEVSAGRFRADLYHRLAVLAVEVPPLRERRDDIEPLARHFVARTAASLGAPVPELSPSLLAVMRELEWPGNVRQLRNVLERAVTLTPADAPLDATTLGLMLPSLEPRRSSASIVDPSIPFHEAKSRLIDTWERDYVRSIVERAGGNLSLAARNSGMSRMSLYRLLEKHGLSHAPDNG